MTLIKDINDIVTPDMENIKRSGEVKPKTFIKYLLYKHINALSSATAIVLFVVVLLLLWFKIVIPLYDMLK